MKTTITISYEYDKNHTTEPDKHAHRCLKSDDMASFIWELVNNGRQRMGDGLDEDTLDVVFRELMDMLDENGIIIHDLWE